MPEVVLLVHDEPAALHSLYRFCKRDGIDVLTAAGAEAGLRVLADEPVVLCLAALPLDGMPGASFVRRACATAPELHLVALLHSPAVADTVAALRAGAHDAVDLDGGRDALEPVFAAALAVCRVARQGTPAAPPDGASPLLGQSAGWRGVRDLVDRVGPSAATVLLQGESGTGKEIVAGELHRRSRRAERPLVKVNCAAIPDALMESELFGYERGAFTGAVRSKKGRFELADGGTIFLDEVGDMSASTQMKVLRVLQEGEFDRVGGTRTQRVDVRVIAATNVDLERAVAERRFREDLYYRLRVIEIRLPPLRERKDDIPLLAQHFVAKFAARNGKRIEGMTPEAMAVLLDHDWPGNVRELENTIERAVVLARNSRLEVGDVARDLRRKSSLTVTFTIGTTLAEIERRMIAEALRYTLGDKHRAARLLGITARTIYRKLEQRRRALEHDADPHAPAELDTTGGNEVSELPAAAEALPERRGGDAPDPSSAAA